MLKIPVIESLENFKKVNHSESVVYDFDNGFYANVSVGGMAKGLELMLGKPCTRDDDYVEEQLGRLHEELVYDDVIGYLDANEIERLLKGIMNLKSYKKEGVN